MRARKKKIIGPSVVVTGAEDLTVGRGVPFSRNAGLPLSDEDHRRCRRRRRRRHADTTCAPLYCVITYIINDDAYNNKMYSYAYYVMPCTNNYLLSTARQMYFELHVRPATLNQLARWFLISRICPRDSTTLRIFPAKNGE